MGDAVEALLAPLSAVPSYLRPCYFEAIISCIYRLVVDSVLHKMNSSVSPSFTRTSMCGFSFVSAGSRFVQAMSLSTVSFLGECVSARLSPLAPRLAITTPSSLAAGLPHFACGIWRNWGRDTFIALPGCLLVTGRFSDAR